MEAAGCVATGDTTRSLYFTLFLAVWINRSARARVLVLAPDGHLKC